MPNSTRRGRSGRVDVIEVFSPRRSGPWHLLHPLRTRFGFAVLAILVLVLLVRHQLAIAVTVAAVDLVLIVLSFSVVWQLTGLLIRSRAELVTLAGLAGADVWLRTLLSAAWASIVLVSIVIVAFALPWSNRFVVARVWCVLDRHRLRLCLRQTKVRTMNMDGSLPLMLWARPTKIGERVWVWVRAGSSGDDIQDAVEYIAPACYAREARVTMTRKLTTLVVIDIIRRDPLGVSHRIVSPLAGFLGRLTRTSEGEGTDPIHAADLAILISTTPDTPTATGRTRTGTSKPTTPAPAGTPVSAPVVVNGEDLSDYIDN